MTFCRNRAFFIPGPKRAFSSNTQGGSRVPKSGLLGSERGRAAMRVPTAILSAVRAIEADVTKAPLKVVTRIGYGSARVIIWDTKCDRLPKRNVHE